MVTIKPLIVSSQDLPDDPLWLASQPCPVIAYDSNHDAPCADALVPTLDAARALKQRIEQWPLASLVLVQVLRSSQLLPSEQALDIESMAYASLQAGPEFAAWLSKRKLAQYEEVVDGEPILLERNGATIDAVLNRAATRNALSVEMRDAWVEALWLLEADETLEQMRFRGLGACFSVGGELREFGSAPDAAVAHWVRTVHSPARLLAKLNQRVSVYLHGACLGSGIELPAFAAHVIAHSNSFFQLPELRMGLIPGAGGTVSIARRIGRQRLAWLVLSGRRINARTALDWGLVDELVDWY